MSAAVIFSTLVPSTALAGTSPASAAELPSLLTVSDSATQIAYDRDLFGGWADADGDGCNTRYEVLIEASTTPVTVTAGCTLTGGTWVSPYDGFSTTLTTEIQIDHVVALAEAWRSGAWAWTDEQRSSFANDLDVPYALATSSSTANQKKADKDPATWLPTNDAYTCEYVISWVLVKYRWSLTVDAQELSVLQSILSGECGATAVGLPDVRISPSDPVVPPQPESGGEIAPFTSGVTRLAGTSRYETAITVSQRYSPGVPAVFVATGLNFPDALSAAAAAAYLGGPLLLTPSGSLPSAVATEITRLDPKHIYIAGDRGVVSATVESSLNRIAPTQRLGGLSRYDTGNKIIETIFPSAPHAFIATGRTFPDALAATGAAGAVDAPVVLVDGTQSALSPESEALLADLGVESVTIVGGTGAVTAAIERQLSIRYSTNRIGGLSRYETAASINDAYFASGSAPSAFLATGLNFPDALAGAALAGAMGSPIFVTEAGCVPAPVRSSVSRFAPESTAVLGGASVVSDNAAANLGCLATSVPTISGTAQVGKTLFAAPGAWTGGTALAYQWYANGRVIAGATSSSISLTDAQFGTRVTVKFTGSKPGYVSAGRTSSESGIVTRPTRTKPISSTTCPSWARIKGNADSMIYHVPGGAYYARTTPEECFSSESAAVAAGYRRSKL
ncbi:cell wall-binding repeat-containing protein [Microbacterium profundi]|uniref:Cell wall-binding repeat-containing protein n=1 Tax=Microbacterium profundi TaxID=450380 RepID=A0ABV3LIW1_9MICO